MRVNLLKPVFRLRESISSRFLHTFIQGPYLSTAAFSFLFSPTHASIHAQSACVWNNKSPQGSFCLQDNRTSASHSGSQTPCHIVPTCSLSLPQSAHRYLCNAKLQERRGAARSHTMRSEPSGLITAKRS